MQPSRTVIEPLIGLLRPSPIQQPCPPNSSSFRHISTQEAKHTNLQTFGVVRKIAKKEVIIFFGDESTHNLINNSVTKCLDLPMSHDTTSYGD